MKKKILLLSDDLRMSSGIATMSKELVLGTIHMFDWIQLGAGINHPEAGKRINVSEDVKNITGVEDAYLHIIPYNSYGDINVIRELIKSESPDAILHFTDPHYWEWLYLHEHEIRQQIPILYYHVWDNVPDPIYNTKYYESCDAIFCISKLTYGIVKRIQKNYKSDFKQHVSYVPHGINGDIFKPLNNISLEFKRNILGEKKYEFILLYNNRNIRRKKTSDVIAAYHKFCDMLPKEKSEKCLLLMHTTPIDTHGTDLEAIVNDVYNKYDIKFTNIKFSQEELNQLYNMVDCTINIANNEGFGLTTAESLMAGTPIIVNVTGGLQDQCGFGYSTTDYIKIGSLHNIKNIKHGEWSYPIWAPSISLNGSVPTPYIFEDNTNIHEVANKILEVYNTKNRKERGLKGREFMLNNLSNKIMCDNLIDGINTTLKNWTPKNNLNLYRVS